MAAVMAATGTVRAYFAVCLWPVSRVCLMNMLQSTEKMKMAERLVLKLYAVFSKHSNDVYFTPIYAEIASVPSCLIWAILDILNHYFYALFYPQRNQKMMACRAYMAGVQ